MRLQHIVSFNIGIYVLEWPITIFFKVKYNNGLYTITFDSSPHEDQSVGMGLGEEWQAGDCGEQQLAG